MSALDWKVYDTGGIYTAATRHPTEAAILVAALGDGARIKYRHHTLCWVEGKEDQSASASYDHVSQVCKERVDQTRRFAHALEEMRRRSPTFQAGEILPLASNIAHKHRVKGSELFDAYTKERARRERQAAKRQGTSERLSSTLKTIMKGDK